MSQPKCPLCHDGVKKPLYSVGSRVLWLTPRNLTAVGVPARLEAKVEGRLVTSDGETFLYNISGIYERRQFQVGVLERDLEKFVLEDED